MTKKKTDWERIRLIAIPVVIVLWLIAGYFWRAAKREAAFIDMPTIKSGTEYNLEAIAKSYYAISTSSPSPSRANVNTVHEWAEDLARRGGINNPFLYMIKGYGTYQLKVGEKDYIYDRQKRELSPDFHKIPVAYDIATGIAIIRNPSQVPLMWTHGLKADGTWKIDSPWEGKTGLVAFRDGNVIKYQGQAEFTQFNSDEKTHDINLALPPGTKILVSMGRTHRPVEP